MNCHTVSTVPQGFGRFGPNRENPMSKIVEQLQASHTKLRADAHLSGCSALLHSGPELADLLDHTCFGRQIATSEQDTHWFQLGLEEAFYMVRDLKCHTISGEDGRPINRAELWAHMISKQETFPDQYRAYSHLRLGGEDTRARARFDPAYVYRRRDMTSVPPVSLWLGEESFDIG
ncbi:hypothetical protein Taro_007690 [Colocasia esculenta]|uniref:tRNA intron endonuclease N-terminal domain-containing protein n=1 Tax=Colocasia esculenta TaxID=4460 RepID=A0A843U4S1_COLES|nr:hypothetical protein [Colocasia esculenta]